MPRQSTSKCRHFGSRPSLTGHGSRAGSDVKSRTRFHGSSHIYLFLWERLRKWFEKLPARSVVREMQLLNKLIGSITLQVIPILFRDDRLEAKKRRKRWVDFRESET